MSIEALLEKLKTAAETVEFDEVMAVIAAHYDYVPGRFTNGIGEHKLVNEAGTNEGSCKIFAFAKSHNLDEAQTLACFGHYYRDEVLNNPHGANHSNIRRFMQFGWNGICFDEAVLTLK